MNGAGLRPEKESGTAAERARGARGGGGPRRGPLQSSKITRILVVICIAAASLGPAACGASAQAVYEGDVRFEHCMSLDAQPDVKPHIKRACWSEWVAFYTYGQTRDRVRHAGRRMRALSGLSEFVAGTGANGPGEEPLEAPEPTSPLLSPPSAVSVARDSGAAPVATASAHPREQCIEECEAVAEDCRRDCRTHACQKSCAMTRRRCTADCQP